jgi:sugar phosphate isomerase/epimerase
MLSGMDLKQYQFSSIHEPCPADISTETLKARDWFISAQDEDNRQQGVRAIKRSIDLASELNVSVIVVHSGNVQVDIGLENQLKKIYKSGQRNSDEYCELLDTFINDREKLVGPRFEAVEKSLSELLDYAGRFGIRLGLENRYHFMDIPVLDEMSILLDQAGSEQLGFILDVGHAQTLDRLGLFPFEAWLTRFGSRILGVHLHDVIGTDDHYAPGLGDVDFDRIAAYIPSDAFRTLELLPKNTPEQVISGLKYLAGHGCIQPLLN